MKLSNHALGLIAGIIGMACIAGAGVAHVYYKNAAATFVETTATVVQSKGFRSTAGQRANRRKAEDLTITYNDPSSGNPRTAETSTRDTSYRQRQPGDKITIYIDPANPGNVMTKIYSNNPYWLAGIGLVLAVVGIGMTWTAKKE